MVFGNRGLQCSSSLLDGECQSLPPSVLFAVAVVWPSSSPRWVLVLDPPGDNCVHRVLPDQLPDCCWRGLERFPPCGAHPGQVPGLASWRHHRESSVPRLPTDVPFIAFVVSRGSGRDLEEVFLTCQESYHTKDQPQHSLKRCDWSLSWLEVLLSIRSLLQLLKLLQLLSRLAKLV